MDYISWWILGWFYSFGETITVISFSCCFALIATAYAKFGFTRTSACLVGGALLGAFVGVILENSFVYLLGPIFGFVFLLWIMSGTRPQSHTAEYSHYES